MAEEPQLAGIREAREAKRRLRKRVRVARREIAPAARALAGEAIVEHWAGEPRLAGAGRVVLYAALPEELPTRPLFDHLRGLGVEVLLPRCGAEQLIFCRVAAWSELVRGRYGVLEPPLSAATPEIRPSDPVLVPGVAFDRRGNRLGQGQGWYDRTFRQPDPGRLIGAGFALQVVVTVPTDSGDCAVGAILTECGFTPVERTA